MPQAKRIKAKPKKKAPANKKRDLPWGLLLVVLIMGALLGALLHGAKIGDTDFGAGLKTLFEQNGKSSDDEDTQAIHELVAKSSEKEFDFYQVLPDIEKVMPDDLPEAQPTRVPDNVTYFVQAASFRKNSDAEKLRARLALKGFKSTTQSVTTEAKGTYYRVRLGPFENKREAKNFKSNLKKLGVNPIVVSVRKKS